ncbi:hypothetical protein BTUL_0061g00120 [Botrytis tulipae]|uniref:Amidase domain-containing protein n=1 Tax=Botrytis tulipae TaxID=87230 RepID=A0A4Z1ENK4_9HELO|nr:hypothetical protein BTUL_0061g00120 [Botrytis tulipae]
MTPPWHSSYREAQDPVGTAPLGCSQTNGRPFGHTVVALANEEHKILQFMTAWDEFTPSRLPPLN